MTRSKRGTTRNINTSDQSLNDLITQARNTIDELDDILADIQWVLKRRGETGDG